MRAEGREGQEGLEGRGQYGQDQRAAQIGRTGSANRRWVRLAVLGGLIIGGTAASVSSTANLVDFSAAVELWGDVLRDVDGASVHLVRVSDADEMRLGATLAERTHAMWVDSPADIERVQQVGQSLTPYVRRHGIGYTFHLVSSPAHNAWAAPGGHIYVTTGLLKFVQSDAELAAVIGHEIGHVDDRHCIERYQYAVRLKKAGLDDIGAFVDFVRGIPRIGYTKYQELDADAIGLRLMTQAGYPPEAAPTVLERLAHENGEPPASRAPNVVVEAGRASIDAIGSYGVSHPAASERARRLRDRIGR